MQRVLIKCGWLVTLDPAIGDFKGGELLFRGNRIEAVGRHLDAAADEVIDATDKIVMPGLVNAHMHTWETALRGIGAEWMTADYLRHMHLNLATRYQPEDNYLGNLIGALGQIDGGVTTLVDWCHNITSIELAERAVDGLIDSGIRAVFAHGTAKPPTQEGAKPFTHVPHPRDRIESLRKGRLAERRRPRDAGDGDPRSGLGRLGGGRARHPHGARARPGVLVAYPPARGLRRSRRLRPHGQGGTARARPQPRARHQLRPSTTSRSSSIPARRSRRPFWSSCITTSATRKWRPSAPPAACRRSASTSSRSAAARCSARCRRRCCSRAAARSATMRCAAILRCGSFRCARARRSNGRPSAAPAPS